MYLCSCICDVFAEVAVQLNILVACSHGQVDVAEVAFEQLLILLVSQVPSNLLADFVEVALSHVQPIHHFLLE